MTIVSTAPIAFRQGPSTYDCWIENIRRFFSRYGIIVDEDTIFQVAKGYHRPEPNGEPAQFGQVRQAIETLARNQGIVVGADPTTYQPSKRYLQYMDLDSPDAVRTALSDPESANPWTVIAGVAEQDLEGPSQRYGHFITLRRWNDGGEASVLVYDPLGQYDGADAEGDVFTWEAVTKAMKDNWDPSIDADACKVVSL